MWEFFISLLLWAMFTHNGRAIYPNHTLNHPTEMTVIVDSTRELVGWVYLEDKKLIPIYTATTYKI